MTVVANPTKAGEFSVLFTSGNNIETYLTEDSGKSWTHSQTIPGIPNTSIAMLTAEYSPKGVLALIWRALYPLAQPAPPMSRRQQRSPFPMDSAARLP